MGDIFFKIAVRAKCLRVTAILTALQLFAVSALGTMLGALVQLPAGSQAWLNPYRAPGAASRDAKHVAEKRIEELRVRFDQGVAMMGMGEFRHAITAFHRVLELEPKIPEAHVNLGFAFFELGDPRGASRFFDGALALAPLLANAHYGKGIALVALGDRAGAKLSLSRFLELSDPTDPFRGRAEIKLRELVATEPSPQ